MSHDHPHPPLPANRLHPGDHRPPAPGLRQAGRAGRPLLGLPPGRLRHREAAKKGHLLPGRQGQCPGGHHLGLRPGQKFPGGVLPPGRRQLFRAVRGGAGPAGHRPGQKAVPNGGGPLQKEPGKIPGPGHLRERGGPDSDVPTLGL